MEKRFFVLGFFMFLLVSPSVFSLAVSPSKTLVFFTEDNLEEELTVSVRNKNQFDTIGQISIKSDEGGLANYTDFVPVNVTFAPGETKSFSFNLSIPEKFNRPGDHEFGFYVRELLPTNGTELITIRTSVGSRFIVRVPYEGYFLSASLNAKSVSVGESVPFELILENLGSLPIDDIQGVLQIYNDVGDKIDETTFEHSLPTQSYEVVELNWDSSEHSYGDYGAKVLLNFKGKTEEAETSFRLGDVHVDIVDYDTKISAGDINKYKATVESKWGNPIQDVFLSLEIASDFPEAPKSQSFDLNPWETRDAIIYVDAENIEKGEYPAKLIVHYEGLVTEEEFVLEVSAFDYLIVYVAVGIFVVVFGIGLIILRKRKQRGMANGSKK